MVSLRNNAVMKKDASKDVQLMEPFHWKIWRMLTFIFRINSILSIRWGNNKPAGHN